MRKVRISIYETGVKQTKYDYQLDSIEDFINEIRNPKVKYHNLYRDIAAAETATERSELKKKNRFAIPCVNLRGNGRGYKNIIYFNGLMVLDFDKLEDPQFVKNAVFGMHKSVIAAWYSVSGKGVRALVKIPVVDTVEQYKSLFFGMKNELFPNTEEFDIAPQNPVLPLFMSHDPNILVREPRYEWTQTGMNEQQYRAATTPEKYVFPENGDKNPMYKKWAISNFEEKIHCITNNGHPQVRSNAYLLGGRVSAGYLTLDEAINVAEVAIFENNYLSKGHAGYVKTAIQMIEAGIDSPLYF